MQTDDDEEPEIVTDEGDRKADDFLIVNLKSLRQEQAYETEKQTTI